MTQTRFSASVRAHSPEMTDINVTGACTLVIKNTDIAAFARFITEYAKRVPEFERNARKPKQLGISTSEATK